MGYIKSHLRSVKAGDAADDLVYTLNRYIDITSARSYAVRDRWRELAKTSQCGTVLECLEAFAALFKNLVLTKEYKVTGTWDLDSDRFFVHTTTNCKDPERLAEYLSECYDAAFYLLEEEYFDQIMEPDFG